MLTHTKSDLSVFSSQYSLEITGCFMLYLLYELSKFTFGLNPTLGNIQEANHIVPNYIVLCKLNVLCSLLFQMKQVQQGVITSQHIFLHYMQLKKDTVAFFKAALKMTM